MYVFGEVIRLKLFQWSLIYIIIFYIIDYVRINSYLDILTVENKNWFCIIKLLKRGSNFVLTASPSMARLRLLILCCFILCLLLLQFHFMKIRGDCLSPINLDCSFLFHGPTPVVNKKLLKKALNNYLYYIIFDI